MADSLVERRWENIGYIYKIKNKINGHVYIGQTRQDYKQRWEQHIKTAFSDAPSFVTRRRSLHKALRKYGVEQFDFSVIEKVEDEELDERERYWIEQENSFYNGYNETFGGQSGEKRFDYNSIYQDYLKTHSLLTTAFNCKCSRDTVRSAVLSNNVKPIDIYSQDIHSSYDYSAVAESYKELQNIKKVAILYKCDTSVVSRACKHYEVSTLSNGEVTRKELGIPVKQIDLSTFETINIFPSASNAAIQVFNDKSKSRNILACCRRKQKTAYGYGWAFLNDAIPKDLTINNKYRKVRQIDKDTGLVLNHFKSGAEAARFLGKGESAAGVILRACRGDINTAYGYCWEYEE